MAKALIITEKPSVARDIVAALGGFASKGGGAYWESDTFLCSFAVGHIFQLLEPEDIDPSYKQWRIASLPIIPPAFGLKPIPGHETRIKQLQALIERDDVSTLINACDAAREGELIFREIVGYVGSKKPVRRLWLQSMTQDAIRSGFSRLRNGTDLDGLGDAAECRSRSDWLIGMNATRAFTERLRIRSERGARPWSVGRVQTPTLALLVDRELQILGHRPRAYYKLTGTFDAGTHVYEGTWFDPAFKAKETEPELKDDRIFTRGQADELAAAVAGLPAVASETREESLRHAPYLFNLTGLQKYMAQRYKWSAKRTLEAAQRCYEQHKVLTYPRTSSAALPSDYRPEVDRLVQSLADHPDYGPGARYLLENGRRNDKRTFDDAAVSDHFAIIPTGRAKGLAGDDEKVYDAVVRRFLATFHPPAVYDRVKRLTIVAKKHHFRTGPLDTLVVPGWMAVYDKKGDDSGDKTLPALAAGQKNAKNVPVRPVGAEVKDEVTRPPPRINEAGLLSLMENAGRQVESEELATALMTAEGLGTAATRADIIQNLKAKEYVDDALRPTFKGIHLITSLKRLHAQRLTSPELTARLELELQEVEKGERSAKTFMAEITRYTADVVEIARGADWRTVYPDKEPLGFCPLCKGDAPQKVYERPLLYACATVTGPDTGCGFRIWKDLSGRYMDRATVELLLAGGRTGDLDGFRTSAGKDFKAALELRAGKPAFVGGAAAAQPDNGSDGGGDRGERSGGGDPGSRRSVGPCPVHEGCQVIETRTVYACETRLKAFAAGDKNPQGVFVGREICRRALTEAEVRQLLKDGVTGELQGFISKAGKPFSAKLRLAGDGRATFEFEPRPAGGERAGASSGGWGRKPDKSGPKAGRVVRRDAPASDAQGRDHKFPRRRARSAPAKKSEVPPI